MPASKALRTQNQLESLTMSELPATCAAHHESSWRRLLRAPGSFIALLTLLFAGLITLLAMIGRGGSQPLVMAMLALLAMIGAFAVFAALAGHLRWQAEAPSDAGLLTEIADQHQDALQVAAYDGTVLYRNAAFRALAGGGEARAPDQLFAGEPAASEALFRLTRAAERSERHVEEIRLRRHGSSEPCCYRVSVAPFHSRTRADAARPLTFWHASDITADRARQEQATVRLESALADLDRLPVGVMSASPDGRILDMNATLAGWLGLDRSRIAAGEIRLSDLGGSGLQAVLQPTATGGPEPRRELDIDLVSDNGKSLPVRTILQPVSARSSTARLVVLRQPSAAGAAGPGAAQVGAPDRLYRAAPFGIAAVRRGGAIEHSNTAFARMFADAGSGPPPTIARLLQRIEGGEGRLALEDAIARALDGKAGTAPVEVALAGKPELTRRLYLDPVPTGEAAAESCVLYVIDSTEQKTLERKFAQSQKMEAVGQLAGGIAHDFNNVLTAIIGFSDLLLQNHRPTDPAFKDIMSIKQSANRAARMVHRLLAFSRRQTLQPEVFSVSEEITETVYDLIRPLGEKIEFKTNHARDLWLVKADKGQFHQVLMNLTLNARDAMPDGGCMTLRTRNVSERESARLAPLAVVPGEYVLIEVSDTGHGMPPEVMAKIFEPFFTTKEVGKGTGLGLAMVYGIVKQTGGYIFPESTPGKGTTFRVYLPRHVPATAEDDASASRADKDRKDRPRDLTGQGRVLLVEDEDAVRSFAVRALKRQGYDVLEAATGIEALEVMEREKGRIDIVVSDVVMPEMDGPTLLKELRRQQRDLKVIFVSGYPDDAFRKSLGEGEAFEFLPKPFTLPQLAAKVKETLGR